MLEWEKSIADPVHGTIPLSDLEIKVLDTPVFQRLRSVKQLGLAHYVFPGVDYSRLSHCLGVCHILSRMLTHLGRDYSEKIDAQTFQLFRLASLLHDIGHYPFSHAMEEAIRNHYSGTAFESSESDADPPNDAEPPGDASSRADAGPTGDTELQVDAAGLDGFASFLGHEAVGKEVLRHDSDLRAVLQSAKYDPEDIAAIFMRTKDRRFVNLVSSDLDADRLDYLLRTAHHSGLPYGDIDLDYILLHMKLDDHERVCLAGKAMRAADHVLLGRFFDYQQVAFQKTVSGLELVLKDVIAELLSLGFVKGSREDVIATISSGKWSSYDDGYIMEQIRSLAEVADGAAKLKATAILNRIPPRLMFSHEYFDERDSQLSFQLKKFYLRTKLDEWSDRFSIERSLWYLWDSSRTFTSTDPVISASALMQEEELEEELESLRKVVRIANSDGPGSTPLTELRESLVARLSGQALFGLRVYVLLEPKQMELRRQIEKEVRAETFNFD